MHIQDRLSIRALNWLAPRFPSLTRNKVDFTPDRIEHEATRCTGFDDPGPSHYRIPLEYLCRDYEDDPDLTFFGRLLCRGILVHLMKNRLLIEADLRADPEIRTESIRRPLFILGLPRTGTTLLYNLLALDPASRPLLYWESMQPSPPPTVADRNTDPRVNLARKQIRRLEFAVPEFRKIHRIVPEGPEECLGLLMNTFTTPFFRGRTSSYRQWLHQLSNSEQQATYQEYRTQLQLLQRHVKGQHWVLKCPSHLMGLAGLLDVFPDAAIVQTHRNPAECIGSLCSLSAAAESLCYHPVKKSMIGDRALEIVSLLLNKGLRGRDEHPDARILDIAYSELARNPVQVVRKIYDHHGYDYSKEFELRLKSYMKMHLDRHKSSHNYDIRDYGISTIDLYNHTDEYLQRFPMASK